MCTFIIVHLTIIRFNRRNGFYFNIFTEHQKLNKLFSVSAELMFSFKVSKVSEETYNTTYSTNQKQTTSINKTKLSIFLPPNEPYKRKNHQYGKNKTYYINHYNYSYRFKRYIMKADEQDKIILPTITEPREKYKSQNQKYKTYRELNYKR